jgi:DNA-binding MarR family transcriptional regulator
VPSDPETETFVALVGVVKRFISLSSVHNTLSGVPIAPRHVAALGHIVRGQPVGMSELAGRMNTSLASMSTIVTELEDLGLVERTPDPHDRRRTRVAVRAEHQGAAQELYDRRIAPIRRTLRQLNPAERQTLLRTLDALSDELDRAIVEAVEDDPSAPVPASR